MNQIELHPSLQQAELRAWHADHDIATEAWSPLAQGALLDDDTIETIAAHHEKTPAQTILRWHLQLGNVVIPKSVTPERIRENIDDLRLRAERGRHGRDRPPRRRRAHRPRPRHLRSPVAHTLDRWAESRSMDPEIGPSAGGSTRSRRRPSSSAARCSRSGRRWRRATSAGRAWRPASTWSAASSSAPAATLVLQVVNGPRAGALALVGGRAGRLEWLSAVVLFVGTLVFAINLLDSLIGDLSPGPVRPPGLVAGHGRLRPLPRLRPPGDGRDLRQLAALLAPAATSAGGSSPSTSSARSSSWSPPSPPWSAPTAT